MQPKPYKNLSERSLSSYLTSFESNEYIKSLINGPFFERNGKF